MRRESCAYGKSIGLKVGCRFRSERNPTCPFCTTMEPSLKCESGDERKGRGEESNSFFTSAIGFGLRSSASFMKSKSDGSREEEEAFSYYYGYGVEE